MLLFNNQHIFTGYIKQLLSEFNLPKYYKHGWPITKKVGYFYNKKVPNYTKNLEIRSNIYDSYTHEYLGEYLRFQRDYNNLDLMPLYNCFSNNLCTNLEINGENFTFNTLEPEYKIYMVPVKFGKEYTVAIDSSMKVEYCCGFYNTYYYKNSDNDIIETTTYKVFRNMTFNSPELIKIVEPLSLNLEESQLKFIYDHEQDLKLFIKLPANNSSSIAILEGNYTQFNDSSTTAKGSKYDIKTNNYVINMRPVIDDIEQDYQEDQPFVPITRLQLLTMNTEISYPFSDKLIEYLTGMAITSEDEIIDNVLRAQEVMKLKKVSEDSGNEKHITFDVDGAWSNKMRALIYSNSFTGSVGNGKEGSLNTFAYNNDNLGYIDKTAETYYKSKIEDKIISIENVDIYPNIYKDSKGE